MPPLVRKYLEAKGKMLDCLQKQGVIKHSSILINGITVKGFHCRVDFAIADNQSITGFKVRLENDSIVKITRQVGDYLKYFNKCIIVCAPVHTESLLKQIPIQAGVWELNKNGIRIARPPIELNNQLSKDLVHYLKSEFIHCKLPSSLKTQSKIKNKAHFIEHFSTNTIKRMIYSELENEHEEDSNKIKNVLKNMSYGDKRFLSSLSVALPKQIGTPHNLNIYRTTKFEKSSLYKNWKKSIALAS